MVSCDKSIGLYIHVPFCKSKCYYCDFNSYAGKEASVTGYFEALQKEIGYYSQRLNEYTIKTVFIGGGTPSLVEARYIYNLVHTCRQAFNISEDAEISMEANPGTLSYPKLSMYKAAGINRLSIGLQAWQDSLLKDLGRIHKLDEFVENYKTARKVGFRNINVDLIFGLPEQTLSHWKETLSNIVALSPEHLSCYSLKIEEGTVFGERLANSTLSPVEDEVDRDMYWFAINELGKHGYNHYEISNFSKPGYQCRHNIIYWKAEGYIGMGAGAHSYINGKRFNNICSVEDYVLHLSCDNVPVENIQSINAEEAMAEFIILGLRLTGGISMKEFENRFGESFVNLYGKKVDKLTGKNLLQINGDNVKLTPTGLDLANCVFEEFI